MTSPDPVPHAHQGQHWVTVFRAVSPVDLVRVQHTLTANAIPFFAKHQLLRELTGNLYSSLVGPVEFQVPSDYAEQAELALAGDFEVHPDQVPAICPACHAATRAGQLDCPACGLFLA